MRQMSNSPLVEIGFTSEIYTLPKDFRNYTPPKSSPHGFSHNCDYIINIAMFSFGNENYTPLIRRLCAGAVENQYDQRTQTKVQISEKIYSVFFCHGAAFIQNHMIGLPLWDEHTSLHCIAIDLSNPETFKKFLAATTDSITQTISDQVNPMYRAYMKQNPRIIIGINLSGNDLAFTLNEFKIKARELGFIGACISADNNHDAILAELLTYFYNSKIRDSNSPVIKSPVERTQPSILFSLTTLVRRALPNNTANREIELLPVSTQNQSYHSSKGLK